MISCDSTDQLDQSDQQSINVKVQAYEESWPKEGNIKVVWSIGRKSKNCFGIGICRREVTEVTIGDLPPINIDEAIELVTSLKFVSTVQNIDNKYLLLKIDKNSYEAINEIFKGDALILEEDFIFENDIPELNLNSSFLIKKGVYPLYYNKLEDIYEVKKY